MNNSELYTRTSHVSAWSDGGADPWAFPRVSLLRSCRVVLQFSLAHGNSAPHPHHPHVLRSNVVR